MRITTFGDIAGQVTAAHANADTVTVACICVPTGALKHVRKRLPSDLPKWRNALDTHVGEVVDVLIKEALACCVASVDKTTEDWAAFWQDAEDVHARTAALSGGSIGYVKAANLVKYLLFAQAATRAFTQAIKTGAVPAALRKRGSLTITEALVFDNEIQGEENRDAFAEILRAINAKQPLVNSLGLKRIISTLQLTTEQAEPLLLLPDYVAGMVQAMKSRADTLSRSAVTRDATRRSLGRLQRHPCFAEISNPLPMKYEDIFPDFKQYIRRHAA